jgi:hypothetical protein
MSPTGIALKRPDMKKLYIATVLVITSLASIQCSKNKSAEQPTASLLTAKAWIFDEVTEYDPGDAPQVLYKRNGSSNIVDFSKADIQFLADGTFQFNDEMDSYNGKWKLLTNTSLQLVQDGTGDSEIFTDLSVTGTSLSMKQNDGASYSIQKYIPKP